MLKMFDGRSAWSLRACLQHRCDCVLWTGYHSLDRTIATISDPAVQAVQLRLMLDPDAEPNALHAPVDDDMFGSAHVAEW